MPLSIKTGSLFYWQRQEYLGSYFKNEDFVISNNAAENAIRPFTVGRKNWLFSDTPRGAKASTAIYSIVETAKANGLDVFKYFELLLTALLSMDFLTNPDILEELLPWNEATQKICKLPWNISPSFGLGDIWLKGIGELLSGYIFSSLYAWQKELDVVNLL